MKFWLSGKYPDGGKDWRQEEKVTTEDETVGWHHWLNGHEFEQALGVGSGMLQSVGLQSWTQLSNWTELASCLSNTFPSKTPGVCDEQGSLVCCSTWGCKESDTTEWLNWNELNWTERLFANHGQRCNFKKIIGGRLIGKAFFEERLKGGKGINPVDIWRKSV